jgi:iron complex outermembrane recepter protein
VKASIGWVACLLAPGTRTSGWLISALLLWVPAAEVSAADALEPIVITATRVPQPALDLPATIDVVDRERIQQGQLEVNLSESLDEVPGVSVQNRQNYAQDLQISVRGFGARSSFGVRGVRLYSDGIPGTMPDGQGQFSQFDLGSVDRIEVLRGPFSALYGNSSGGVIAIFTQDGPPGEEITATAAAGTFGMHRIALKGAGSSAAVNYVVDAAHFDTDGYRQHSAAERNNFNSKLRIELPSGGRLTLLGNAVQTPFVQDPLGLTQAQLNDPTQAGTNALAYNTRKSISQAQVGVGYDRPFSQNLTVSALLYGGNRATTQFQAIPRSVEALATHPGGVIELGRNFAGGDWHMTATSTLGGAPLQVTAGLSYDDLLEARKGYLNFVGNALGVEGALRRDENNRAYDLDEYVQGQWSPGAHWRVLAGLRHSDVEIRSTNKLVTTGLPAESSVHFQSTNPVAGLTYLPTKKVAIYGSFGRGFETPTLNDLAYRSVDGTIPGLNLGLRAAQSNNYELGVKRHGTRLAVGLSAFYTSTTDELAVLQSSGGRTVYQNIAATQRRGVELALTELLGAGWSSRLAYTWIRAVVVPGGNRLPAVPQNALYSALDWQAKKWGLHATLEIIARAKIFANDLNTQAANGYGLGNLSVGLEQSPRAWHFSEFVRVDNLADRAYVGSVIVNESNSRFFEPDPGRTIYLGFSVTHH